MAPHRIVNLVRDADWLDAGRVRVYSAMLAIGLVVMTVWLSISPPLASAIPGGDFVSFYAASALAQAGHAATAWRPQLHAAAQHAALPGFDGYLAFFYPPPYLLVCWGLALLPFGAALLTWVVATALAAIAAVAAFVRSAGASRGLALLLLALPAVWINALAGQNGALSLAILAAGFALLKRTPAGAGLVLGLMVIKPQLAVALPFVLAAASRWPTFVATAASAVACCLVSLLLFGPDSFAAFFANAANARAALDAGGVDPALMQSLFGMLQPASPAIAYVGQAALAVLVLAIACWTASRARPDPAALGALMVTATLLATPFLLDYDLLLGALPIVWIVARGARTGFAPWEKAVCVVASLLPLFTRELGLAVHLHLAPLVCLMLFAVVVRRIVADAAAVSRTDVEPSALAPVHG